MTNSLTFPVLLDDDDNGTVLVTLPDFPGATFGEDADDALARAQDLLITALEDYMSRRQPIPAPSAGSVRVGLPPSVALKVTVYQEMLKRGLTKAALAARMHQPKQQLDRFFKLRYRSRADQIDAAWNALGLTVRGVELGSSHSGARTITPSGTGPGRAARKVARPRVAARKR